MSYVSAVDLSFVEHARTYREAVRAAYQVAAQVTTPDVARLYVDLVDAALTKWDDRLNAEPRGMLFIWIAEATMGLRDLRYSCRYDTSLDDWRRVCQEALERMDFAARIDAEDGTV